LKHENVQRIMVKSLLRLNENTVRSFFSSTRALVVDVIGLHQLKKVFLGFEKLHTNHVFTTYRFSISKNSLPLI